MTLLDGLFYYVLGGITFLPLCIAALVAYVWYTAEPIDGILDAREAESKARGRELAEDVGAAGGGDGPGLGFGLGMKGRMPGQAGGKDLDIDALDLASGGTSGTNSTSAIPSTASRSNTTSTSVSTPAGGELSSPLLKAVKDSPDVDVPPSARRLGPVKQPSSDSTTGTGSSHERQLKSYRAGWVVVRRHFDVLPPGQAVPGGPSASASTATTTAQGTTSSASLASTKAGAASSSTFLDREGTSEKDDAAASVSSNSSQKRGVMSAVYRGILDYRTQRAEAKRQRQASASAKPFNPDLGESSASGASAGASGAGSGAGAQANGATGSLPPNSPNPSASNQSSQTAYGATGRDQYYCMLKGPILYIYSSDDIKSPNTECYAAIDMRGKRVSIYVAGVGDAQGEPEDGPGGEDEEEDEEDAKAAVPSGRLPSAILDKAPGVLSRAGSAESTSTTRAQTNWRKAQRAAIKDGELFVKRNAVRIVSFNPDAKGAPGSASATPAYSQWFVFAKSATQLEDWYHALLHASWLPKKKREDSSDAVAGAGVGGVGTTDPLGGAFSSLDMVALLASLDTIPDPIPLRWLNAVLGRIFFTIYRTQWLENYITNKMMKKIRRVKTPSFLSNLRVREVDVGHSPPAFSRPMLKTLTGDGEASMEVSIHYTGQLRITISTDLTISLGSRFKPYTVSLLLAVIIRSLEGNLLLMIKPPPSNRLWFGFTAVPKMNIGIEPVVSERKVQWGMVTRLIEGRIRELLSESLVVPNMDDVPFFDTRKLGQRGGVWASAAKLDPTVNVPAAAAAPSKAEQPIAAPSSKVPPVKSAPVTPVGTPAAPGTPTIDEGAGPVADSSAVEMSRDSAAPSLRSRRTTSSKDTTSLALDNGASHGSPSSESLLSLASPANSSAAIAGLRNTLSRDMAATRSASGQGPASTASNDGRSSLRSSSGSSAANNARRRSWLPLGTKQGAGVTTLGGAPLSSMALGHASFVREGQDAASVVGTNGSLSGTESQSYASDAETGMATGSEAETEPEARRPRDTEGADSVQAARLRAQSSQSSLSADESVRSTTSISEETDDEGRDADRDTDAETDDGGRRAIVAELVEPSTSGASHALPSISAREFEDGIDRTSTPVGGARSPALVQPETPRPDKEAFPREMPPSSAEATMAEESQGAEELQTTPPLQQKDKVVGEPTETSVASSTRSSTIASSPSERGRSTPSRTPTFTLDSESGSQVTKTDTQKGSSVSGIKDYSDLATSVPRSPSVSRSVSSAEVDPSQPLRREAPPARPHIFEDGRPIYNPHATRGVEGSGSSVNVTMNTLNTQTTMLWNKAKASLADKEARQAAAKDAKEAIKRGWASWNAKRAENRAIANATAPGMVPQRDSEHPWSNGPNLGGSVKDYSSGAGIGIGAGAAPASPSAASSSSSSRWFASSPPDPAALGLGIEPTRTLSGESSPRSRFDSTTSGAGSSDQAGGGPAPSSRKKTDSLSSETCRPAYRDHLASKHQQQRDAAGASTRVRTTSSSTRTSSSRPSSIKAGMAEGGGMGLSSTSTSTSSSASHSPTTSKMWDAPLPTLAPPAPVALVPSGDDDDVETPSKKASAEDGVTVNASGPGDSVGLRAPPPTAGRVPSSTSSPSASASAPVGNGDESPSPPVPAASALEPARMKMSASPAAMSPLEDHQQGVGSNQKDKEAKGEGVEGLALPPAIKTSPGSTLLELSPVTSRPSTVAAPSSSSVSTGGGVRTQPARAPMMAVPGIPPTQKSGPQSFSAPAVAPTPAGSSSPSDGLLVDTRVPGEDEDGI